MSVPAYLALEDGSVFTGYRCGAPIEAEGEVVFNTGMTGYQEILTDPSYSGQIVTMTYPLVGNYGTNSEDVESNRVHVKGFIVKELCENPSNWRSEESLDDYLKKADVPIFYGLDTRALVRKLRVDGVMRGVIGESDPEKLVERARQIPEMSGQDLASKVTTDKSYNWPLGTKLEKDKPLVIVYDYGVKYSILRYLESNGCAVKVVPSTTSPEDILSENPAGLMLSNGPGDPAAVGYAVENVRNLLGKLPVFGICLGHQILGLAAGGQTYKLKFGHRGINHPVQELDTKKVRITSQNHGFAVDIDSIKDPEVKISQVNLNDNTVEGMENLDKKWFSVQYHPEAAPGPHDSNFLFQRFFDSLKK